jgi:hypothetical protein
MSVEIPLEDLTTRIKQFYRENMDNKILEKKADTFSILYRSGTMYKENNQETPYLTGNFAEDISDYFKNLLIEGGVDVTSDITIRTSSLSWTIYFEIYHNVINGMTCSDLLAREDLNSYPPYTLNIMENIPMCLFDKFNIINYPRWGEVFYFNYYKLKAEILGDYIISGSRESLVISYNEVLDIMEKFPNKYNLLNEKTIEVSGVSGFNATKPIEILREEKRIKNLIHTELFERLLEEKREIERNKPDPDEEGVYVIENGRHIKGPNYDSWKARHNEWVIRHKSWYENIDQDYKLCFIAWHIHLPIN